MKKILIPFFFVLLFYRGISQSAIPIEYKSMAIGMFTPLSKKAELDTLAILIVDNIHVFKVSSHWVRFTTTDNDLNNDTGEEKITQKYYAFNVSNQKGFSSIGGLIIDKNLRLDSFLTQRLPQFTSDSSLKPESYTYYQDSTKEYNLIETYLSKSSEKNKYPDSTIFYYNSKFQDLEYGLNIRKEKQAQINKKLQKIKLIYLIDEKELKENTTTNQMILSFELMDLPKHDIDPLLSLAKKAKLYFELMNNQ